MENDIVKLIVSGAGVSEANTEYTESRRIQFPAHFRSDNVRRWESSNGYEMFRFNVPGKGFFSVSGVMNRKEFWAQMVLWKDRQ